MNTLLYGLAGMLCFSLLYSWLEWWLETGTRAKIRTLETEDPEWLGLGIPYHIPIMLGLFLTITIFPLHPLLTVCVYGWLVVLANLLLGFLVEDLTVQIRDYLAGEGWIKESDWSSKWGYIPIPFTEEAVIPIWYVAYTGIIIVLYALFFTLINGG